MKLYKNEARLLAELARTPGRAVGFDVLVDATDCWRDDERASRKALAALVHFVRVKFGPDVIETVRSGRWTVGYALRPGALRGGP